MLDKTLLFLTFATGKQLPFNSPLFEQQRRWYFWSFGTFAVHNIAEPRKKYSNWICHPNSSADMCNAVTFSTCLSKKSVNKKSLDHYTMRFWWLPINAVSDEKTLNFQLKSEKSINQISSRGGMTEIFRHKIIIWIVCGKGIEIWCFSLYCVDVCM